MTRQLRVNERAWTSKLASKPTFADPNSLESCIRAPLWLAVRPISGHTPSSHSPGRRHPAEGLLNKSDPVDPIRYH